MYFAHKKVLAIKKNNEKNTPKQKTSKFDRLQKAKKQILPFLTYQQR